MNQEELIGKINMSSNIIHKRGLSGSGNYMIVSSNELFNNLYKDRIKDKLKKIYNI